MEMTVQTCGNDSWGICVDHVYLSVAIPLLKLSILKFMMYLKGKIDMIIKPNETEVKGIIIVGIITVTALWLMMIPGDKVESSYKILLAIIDIALGFAFLVKAIHSGGTVSLNEEGCCISWCKNIIKREYTWEQLQTKRIVYMKKEYELYDRKSRKGVVFSPSIIKKNSSWNNPFTEHIGYSGGIGQGDLLIEELIHFFRPLNIIYIFCDEEDKENDEKDIYYLTVNEKNFMEKMAEWHVELEDNKPEEIPPWKEKI